MTSVVKIGQFICYRNDRIRQMYDVTEVLFYRISSFQDIWEKNLLGGGGHFDPLLTVRGLNEQNNIENVHGCPTLFKTIVDVGVWDSCYTVVLIKLTDFFGFCVMWFVIH